MVRPGRAGAARPVARSGRALLELGDPALAEQARHGLPADARALAGYDRPVTRARAYPLFVLGSALSFLLLCTTTAAWARAWTWTLLGVGGITVSGAGCLLLLLPGLRVPRPRLRRAAQVALGVGALPLALLLPSSRVDRPAAPIRSCFADGARDKSTWFAGVPERETTVLGAVVGLAPDERARHLDALREHCAAADANPAFDRDSSPAIESWVADRGQYWLAVPDGPGPFPLVVFLHGNGGTIRLYAHLLAEAARARGLAIAFPAWGLGIYADESAVPLVERTVAAAAREDPRIDPSRLALVGLSAGAWALCDVVAAPGRRPLRVVGSIAGALPSALSRAAVDALRGTKVLIEHGGADPRCSVINAVELERGLRAAGVDLEALIEADADHLALLERREVWVPWLLDRCAAGLAPR